jgi:transcriptional regulator with XRE-family HTH domain
MRVLLQLAGWTQSAFAEKFQVPVDAVRDWLSGERGVPVWVLPVLRMLEQLTPAMQQQAFRRRAQAAAGTNRKRNAHPFARIEEL